MPCFVDKFVLAPVRSGEKMPSLLMEGKQIRTDHSNPTKRESADRRLHMDAVINCAAYCEGRRVASVEIGDMREVLKKPDQFVWIGLHEPEAEMLQQVQFVFGLHDLAIEDALRAHQRP